LPNADHRVENPSDRRIAIPAGERQYHIGLGPGELAEYILLPGDPDRTSRIASRFESIELEHRHREFVSATGRFRGQRLSVVSTGIGTDNVEIVVAEILAITERPTFIRVGSCGALQPEMTLGDLVITTGAVRLESTTSFFVHDGYPAVADYEAVAALVEAAERLGHPYHVGGTATAPGVVSWWSATARIRSTSARCADSWGSWNRSLCLRQSSSGRCSIRSRVIAPVRRPDPIGE